MGAQRNYDSNGPDVKIRGTAAHIFDRYCQLARDAHAAGDRVAAENYQQHAEHYYRIMVANGLHQQRQNPQQHPQHQQPFPQGPQPSVEMGEGEMAGEGEAVATQPMPIADPALGD